MLGSEYCTEHSKSEMRFGPINSKVVIINYRALLVLRNSNFSAQLSEMCSCQPVHLITLLECGSAKWKEPMANPGFSGCRTSSISRSFEDGEISDPRSQSYLRNSIRATAQKHFAACLDVQWMVADELDPNSDFAKRAVTEDNPIDESIRHDMGSFKRICNRRQLTKTITSIFHRFGHTLRSSVIGVWYLIETHVFPSVDYILVHPGSEGYWNYGGTM